MFIIKSEQVFLLGTTCSLLFEYLIFSSFTIGRVCRNKLHEKLAGITRLHRTYFFYMGNQLFVIYISRRCDINFVILSLVYIVLFGLKNKLLVELLDRKSVV